MDELELNSAVHPGIRVGPFKLGMSLVEILSIVKSRPPNGSQIKKTLVYFSRTYPVDRPIILDIQMFGVKLRFEPKSQKLFIIDVYDISKLSVSFQGHMVGGKHKSSIDAATLKNLYGILGITHSGFRREELGKDAFCLQYPGLLIAFRVPEMETFSGIPLVLSDGSSPEAMRLVVHDFEFPKQPLKMIKERPFEVIIKDDEPVRINFKNLRVSLILGQSHSQDILTALGQPSKVHLKQPDPLGTKARRQGESNNVEDTGDYFLNYFDLGIDILLDGAEHVVKKVILRTNLICHPTFGVYDKCSFEVKFIERPSKKVGNSTMLAAVPTNGKLPSKKASAPSFEDLLTLPPNASQRSQMVEKLVSCDDNWAAISKKLELSDEKPMVHERADQPFGPCLLYGYKHCVFEVDRMSQYLSSFTVF